MAVEALAFRGPPRLFMGSTVTRTSRRSPEHPLQSTLLFHMCMIINVISFDELSPKADSMGSAFFFESYRCFCCILTERGKAGKQPRHLKEEGPSSFDLIFIDADKVNNPAYLQWALKLSRPGTVIITDNVIRDGKVLDPDSDDPNVRGIRTFIDQLSEDPRIDSTVMQTVGMKGYDGFVIGMVKH